MPARIVPHTTRFADTCRLQAAGVSLVELLVAVSISTVTLMAAWSWLWSVGSASSAVDGRAQASTAGAFVLRTIGHDLEVASALLQPPAPRSPATCLCLRHSHPGEADETVVIAWDAQRGVIWRKASGTYLADHVSRFAVSYFEATGGVLGDADFGDPAWPSRVARVRVLVCIDAGAGPVTVEGDLAVRP